MMCSAIFFGPLIDVFSTMYSMRISPIGGARPRFALTAHSIGGILAMEIFRQAPQWVDRVARRDTNPLA